MIPRQNQVALTTGGVLEQSLMRIDASSLVHVMSILTNLYTDPYLAVIREYSTNARDSHIAAGRKDVPIVVKLPTIVDPTFKVIDTGVGMSKQDISEIYTSYGMSTKTQSNEFNGTLGFGCKSAFAVCNQFALESVKDGMKYVYSFHLEKDSYGASSLLYSGETDEPNGVSVSIPIPVSDIPEFMDKARVFYYTFGAEVIFRSDRKDSPLSSCKYTNDITYTCPVTGIMTVSSFNKIKKNVSGVLMGGVLYPHPLVANGVIVPAEIGDVYFSPNRESIVDDSQNNKFVLDKINTAYEFLKSATFDELINSEDVELTKYGIFNPINAASTAEAGVIRGNAKRIGSQLLALRAIGLKLEDDKRNREASTINVKVFVKKLKTDVNFSIDSSSSTAKLSITVNIGIIANILGLQLQRIVSEKLVTLDSFNLDLTSPVTFVNLGERSSFKYSPTHNQGLKAFVEDEHVNKNLTIVNFSDSIIQSVFLGFTAEEEQPTALEEVHKAYEIFKALSDAFGEVKYEFFKEYFNENCEKPERLKYTGVGFISYKGRNRYTKNEGYFWEPNDSAPMRENPSNKIPITYVYLDANDKIKHSILSVRVLDSFVKTYADKDTVKYSFVTVTAQGLKLLKKNNYLHMSIAEFSSILEKLCVDSGITFGDYDSDFGIIDSLEEEINPDTAAPYIQEVNDKALIDRLRYCRKLIRTKSSVDISTLVDFLPKDSKLFTSSAEYTSLLEEYPLISALDNSISKRYYIKTPTKRQEALILSGVVRYLNAKKE